jgi:hypothetical protein
MWDRFSSQLAASAPLLGVLIDPLSALSQERLIGGENPERVPQPTRPRSGRNFTDNGTELTGNVDDSATDPELSATSWSTSVPMQCLLSTDSISAYLSFRRWVSRHWPMSRFAWSWKAGGHYVRVALSVNHARCPRERTVSARVAGDGGPPRWSLLRMAARSGQMDVSAEMGRASIGNEAEL